MNNYRQLEKRERPTRLRGAYLSILSHLKAIASGLGGLLGESGTDVLTIHFSLYTFE
jgi:hypothetical protein